MKKQFVIVTAILIAMITTQQANARFMLIDSIEQSNVNTQAIRNFEKEFPTVFSESWYKSNDGGYTAIFSNDSVHTIVGFNSKGRLIGSIKYFDEKYLPGNIWLKVKSTYYAYNILTVAEVNFNNKKIYIISLENDKYAKKVRVADEDFQEIESFEKFK